MSLSSRLLPSSLAALGAAAMVAAPSAAHAQDSPFAISAGLSFTAQFGQKLAFGLGLDVRGTALFGHLSSCSIESRHGAGAYGQVTWLNFSHWRFGSGLHGGGEVVAQTFALDGEVGWTYHTRYDDAQPGEHGLQLGLVGTGAPPGAAFAPLVEVPVRAVLPVGSPFFQPEGIVGAGIRWPSIFGLSANTCVTGRPLRTTGGILLPPIVARGRRPRRHAGLDADTRAALAGAWLEDARMECASVPAFLALARDLAAAGAPPALVDRALGAAGDEIRHTALCSEIAADASGLVVDPLLLAPPPAADADRRDALLRMALEAWLDGCVGEGAAALRAEQARVGAQDPACVAALGQIARDEARHAELGWAVLSHCLAAGGSEVGEALAEAIARPAPEPPPGDVVLDAEPGARRAHGRLDQAGADQAWRETVRAAQRRAAGLLAA